MASTPARSNSPRARSVLTAGVLRVVGVVGVASAVGVVVGAAGCGPQVTITVTRADDLNELLPVPFLRFAFRPEGSAVDEPLLAGPFASNAVPDSDYAKVAPGVPFSVDVQGCNEQDPAACATEDKFIARGCEGGFVRARDETLAITIALHPSDVGNALCPVEAPDSDEFVPPPPTGEGEGEGEGETG